jgi:hypothetical protein
MEWTKERPTQTGWYWMTDPECKLPIAIIVYVDIESGEVIYPSQKESMLLDIMGDTPSWIGPLEEPVV